MEASKGDENGLRIALCVYRGNPFSGGQGVYTKYLTEALLDLGHAVTVFSGPPYPELDSRAELVKIKSLDLYRQPDPFRVPKLEEFESVFDLIEFGLMSTGAFPEPRVFGYRAGRLIAGRAHEFDVIHDNQSLNWSLLRLHLDGMPMVASIHHPITVDRRLDMKAAKGLKAKFGAFRWYGFVRHQCEVARRINSILTVSETSRRDLASSMGIDPQRVRVVPIGVDTTVFRPLPGVERVPFTVVTTASADVPLKGLVHLVEAFPLLVRAYPQARLSIIGATRPGSAVQRLVDRLGLRSRVEFLGKVSQEEIVSLYSVSQVACVPSLYEGFSLPAIEAMACGIPLVATDGGALPEVVGDDGAAALIARAGDAASIAEQIARVFDSPELASSLSHHARLRVLARYSWRSAALATVEVYRAAIKDARGTTGKTGPPLGAVPMALDEDPTEAVGGRS